MKMQTIWNLKSIGVQIDYTNEFVRSASRKGRIIACCVSREGQRAVRCIRLLLDPIISHSLLFTRHSHSINWSLGAGVRGALASYNGDMKGGNVQLTG